MNGYREPEGPKPIGAIWRRVRDLDPAHRNLKHAGAREAATRAEGILAGSTHYRHGNGGITSKGVYYAPETRPANRVTEGHGPDSNGDPSSM